MSRAKKMVRLEIADGIAVLTNDQPEKHNAVNDAMDRALFDALEELHTRPDASTRMMLPEIKHGVIPDSGGTARLFQMAGHGLAADLALTGRVMDAEEALRHGVVSRVVADEKLEEVAMEMCREIASHPPFAVKMIRRTLARIAHPLAQRTMQEESMGMTAIYETQDHAEMKAARAEGRPQK